MRKRLERILDIHVARRRLGAIFGNVGFVLARDPDTVRGPDLSFVARERLVGIDYSRFFEGAPDLAIEILSPFAPRVLGADDDLDGEDVLPTFRINVAAIFESSRGVEA